MSDVFVSYKAEDRRRIRPLVQALEAAGYSVWWDQQIGGGANWRHMIEAELNAAECVIVAWSKRSVGPEGTFVQDEATRAQQRRVYVPVLFDKVHLPLGFGETQALSLVGWKGGSADARFQAVLGAVRRLAGERESLGETLRPVVMNRRVIIGGAAAATAAVAGGAWMFLRPDHAGASDSIAVLPFANLSGDPAQAYFSDGIAEELRSALARLAGLQVVGRISSDAVRNDDAQTASRKLAVANILTGSVRNSSSTIRIAAQLIDGATGLERWSQTYDRAPGDAIKIQTDIAENVARALSIALGATGKRALTIGGTRSVEAQDLLLKAEEATRDGDRESLFRGIALADAAIKIDPRYADAYAQKAFFLNWIASTYSTSADELARLRSEAKLTIQTALRIAPDFANAHRVLAEIHRVNLDLGAAIRGYRKALELAPNDSTTLANYAVVTGALGDGRTGLAMADRAIHLDPLNDGAYFNRYGVLVSAGRFEEAASFAKQMQIERPHAYGWFDAIAYALIIQGKLAEAKPYIERSAPDSYNRLVNEGVLAARTGNLQGVPRVIARMKQLFGDAASYQEAEVYAQAGDKNRAFAALDRAYEIRDAGLVRVKTDPYLQPLRNDPRYAALLRKLNFPEL